MMYNSFITQFIKKNGPIIGRFFDEMNFIILRTYEFKWIFPNEQNLIFRLILMPQMPQKDQITR